MRRTRGRCSGLGLGQVMDVNLAFVALRGNRVLIHLGIIIPER